MEFSSFQRLFDITPTQEEYLAVAQLIDNGSEPIAGTPYIKAPFILVDRVRQAIPNLRTRTDVEILYDPRSHAVWMGIRSKPPASVQPLPAVHIEKVTLSKFIADNDSLLTVIGILLGVAVFSNQSPAKPIGQIVVFCIFGAALLAWGELLFIYNKTAFPASGQLKVFMLFLANAFIGSVFYWLIEFSVLRTFAIAALLLQLAQHIFFARWLENARSQLRRNLLLLLIGIGCLFLGALLNVGLDRVTHYLVSLQETKQQKQEASPPARTPN
jgi:hypothetical protein